MFPTENSFETKVTLESSANIIDQDDPFHILLLGNWTGISTNRDFASGSNLPVAIDRDNFDEVFKQFGIKLELDLAGEQNSSVCVCFNEFDDFHPDNIFRQLPCFAHLRSLRRDLLNTATFNSAAKEIRSWFDSTHSIQTATLAPANNPDNQIEPVDLLDRILNSSSDEKTNYKTENIQSDDLRYLVSKIVKPFIVQTDENEQNDLLSLLDKTTSKLMREILHHPLFKNLESLWRGLDFLVKRIETDNNLKIFIFDISKDELSADLKSKSDLSQSNFYKTINNDDPHSTCGFWSVIGGFYEFNLDIDDTALLIRLAKICDDANLPFISSIDPKIFIKNSDHHFNDKFFDENLTTVQSQLLKSIHSLTESSSLGLIFPPFLARLPFGEQTEPLDSFSFEEIEAFPSESDLLWVNPVIAGVLLIAQSFQLHGWQMGNNFQRQVDNSPLYFYRVSGETKRILLQFEPNENTCLQLLELGIMPLISFQNSDSIRFVRFQSLKNPFSPLKGKWS